MRLSVVASLILTTLIVLTSVARAAQLDIPTADQYLFIEHPGTQTRLTPALQAKLNAILKGLIDPRSVHEGQFEEPISELSGWGVVAILPGKLEQAKRAINNLEGFEANSVIELLSDVLVQKDWTPVPNVENRDLVQETATQRALVMRTIRSISRETLKPSVRAQLAENLIYSTQSMVEAYESFVKAYAYSIRLAYIRQKKNPDQMDKTEMVALNSSRDLAVVKSLLQFNMQNAIRAASHLGQPTAELVLYSFGHSGSLIEKMRTDLKGNPALVDHLFDIVENDLQGQLALARDYERVATTALAAELKTDGAYRKILDGSGFETYMTMMGPDIVNLGFEKKDVPQTSFDRIVYQNPSFTNWYGLIDSIYNPTAIVALQTRKRIVGLIEKYQKESSNVVTSIHDLQRKLEATDIAKYRAEKDSSKSVEEFRDEVAAQLLEQGRARRVGNATIISDILNRLQAMATGHVYQSTLEDRVDAAVSALFVLQDIEMRAMTPALKRQLEYIADRIDNEMAHSKFMQESVRVRNQAMVFSRAVNENGRFTERSVMQTVPKTCEALFR